MTVAIDSLHFAPRLDVAARSAAGAGPSVRPENQDNFLLIDTDGVARYLHDQEPRQQTIPSWTKGHARVAVLDGMGGHGRGREAAEAVVAGLLAMPPCTTLGQLTASLDELHMRLQGEFGGDSAASNRPGTTLTMLELRPGQAALLYHVGDSRLYEITSRQAIPLTVDHVPATVCAMAGVMDEDEWWHQVHGEHRSQITQAFILGNAFADPAVLNDPLFALSPLNLPPFLYHLPDRRAMELMPGSVYLLATDGFWACDNPAAWVGRWPGLLHASRSAEEICNALFDEIEARPPRGLHPDNLTAIVLRPRTSTEETALPVDNRAR